VEALKPNITLAETKAPNGARMTLVEHDGSYCIRVNGQQLMHSSVATSEIELGRLGVERLVNRGQPAKVLIGGLGLGFTLKSVLSHTGPRRRCRCRSFSPRSWCGTGRFWPGSTAARSPTLA
jgi:hypothetical protein